MSPTDGRRERRTRKVNDVYDKAFPLASCLRTFAYIQNPAYPSRHRSWWMTSCACSFTAWKWIFNIHVAHPGLFVKKTFQKHLLDMGLQILISAYMLMPLGLDSGSMAMHWSVHKTCTFLRKFLVIFFNVWVFLLKVEAEDNKPHFSGIEK